MVSTQYVKEFLKAPNLSDAYAQKYIDASYGDKTILDELLFAEKAKRATTDAIREVK